jgi:hypothetical protein
MEWIGLGLLSLGLLIGVLLVVFANFLNDYEKWHDGEQR